LEVSQVHNDHTYKLPENRWSSPGFDLQEPHYFSPYSTDQQIMGLISVLRLDELHATTHICRWRFSD